MDFEIKNHGSKDLYPDQVHNRRRERKVRRRKEKRGRRKEGLEAIAQRIRRDLLSKERRSGVLSR